MSFSSQRVLILYHLCSSKNNISFVIYFVINDSDKSYKNLRVERGEGFLLNFLKFIYILILIIVERDLNPNFPRKREQTMPPN